MYDEAEYLFDWHSVAKRIIMVVIILTIIAIIILLFNKSKTPANYFDDNLNTMTSVATRYYQQSNATEKITLKEMIDRRMLIEFVDEDGSMCDINNSYATVENNHVKVFLKCNSNQETKISDAI